MKHMLNNVFRSNKMLSILKNSITLYIACTKFLRFFLHIVRYLVDWVAPFPRSQHPPLHLKFFHILFISSSPPEVPES